MLELLEIRALVAPNIWGPVPVLECRLVCEPISDEIIEGVFQRLHGTPCSTRPMDRRHYPSPAHALVELALELQRRAESPVAFGEVRPTPFAHIWQLAFEIEQEQIGRAALEAACRLLSSAVKNRAIDHVELLAQLRRISIRYGWGGTTCVLVAEARRRGIPVYRLDDESLIQLGQGAKQHRLRMAATDRTGFIAEWISRDKLLTKQLLRKVGVPVAHGRLAADAEDACRAAREIGGPVVVKPCDADFGRGVSVDLTDSSEIRGAFEVARAYSEHVLVENYLPGYWHRLLVVQGEMIAAVRKEPPCVVGDGQRTIAELIEEYNADPRRGSGDEYALDPLIVGATVLGMLYRQGYSLDSVPPAGFRVRLRPDAYLSSGATQTDVTNRVHPEFAEIAIDAAETIGLDVAGIDLICEEISRPPAEQPVGVLEVNAEPAIVVHLAPMTIPSRPVAERIISSLFPAGETGRVPVVAMVNNLPLARTLADRLQQSGHVVGFAAKNQACVNQRRIGRGELSVLAAAEILWMHRRLDAAVLHFGFRDVLETGLPLDRCDVLCLAGLDELEAARSHPDSEEWERVLALLMQPLQPARDVLVNVDDEMLRRQLPRLTTHALLVSQQPERLEIQRQLAGGGRCLTTRDGQLLLHAGAECRVLTAASGPGSFFDAAVLAWLEQAGWIGSTGPTRNQPARISA